MKQHSFNRIIATLVAVITFFACAYAQEPVPVQESAEREADTFEFGYDAGAEIVTSYLWRGMYNGGLSFQPDLAIGWDSKHTSFRFGTWWSVGASDWRFRKGWEKTYDAFGTECNPNTYFIPELDIYADFNIWGATVGFTHYYYFGGSNFFTPGNDFFRMDELGNTSQTELNIGYDFETLLGIGLYFKWHTMISGNDYHLENMEVVTEDEDGTPLADEDVYIDGDAKRSYSSYLELGYKYTWEKIGLTLSGAIGMSPWKSLYTGQWYADILKDDNGNFYIDDHSKNFAVNNISIRLEKEWDLDVCTMSLFGQGMLNTCNLNKDTWHIHGAGDDKMGQKVNATVGMSVWF